jgi:hypothetical protein
MTGQWPVASWKLLIFVMRHEPYTCVHDKPCVLVFGAWSVITPQSVQEAALGACTRKLQGITCSAHNFLLLPQSPPVLVRVLGGFATKWVAEASFEVKVGAPGSPYKAVVRRVPALRPEGSIWAIISPPYCVGGAASQL